MSGYEIASLAELESVQAAGTLQWTPLRRHFGITAFGISAYTASEAGQDVIEEHTEETLGHEELYVVISGRATFVLDGEEREVPAGSVVFLRDPKVKRYARAAEPGTTVLAIGGKPGRARGVRLGVLLPRLRGRRRGSASDAVAELQAGLAEKPDHPGLHYHLACIYARAGTARRGARPRSTGRSSSTPSCRSGRTRTRTWSLYASPGRRRPGRALRAARAPDRPPGRATTSTAP